MSATTQSRPKIAVVYVCDAGYHDLTVYSLASVARVHSAPLDFHLLQSEYQRPVPTGLQELMVEHSHSLMVRNAPPMGATVALSNRETRFSHISAAMFLKASAIDALSTTYDYILYLDGDILAFDDLHLEKIAGFSETAAVCLDLSSASGFDDPSFASNCLRSGVSPKFFNSGVMMINCQRWLETRSSERFMENLALHEANCPYFTHCVPNDQCAFNMTLGFDLKLLPVSWNVQKSALQTRFWESALVRHYTGPAKFLPIRPWTCDPREYDLIRTISEESRLPLPRKLYDFGLSYRLNKRRRQKTISKYDDAIEKMSALIGK